MVAGRVRVDLAAAATAWLAPWAAWLAGDGGVISLLVLVIAAFWVSPLVAVPLAVVACGLHWGLAGTSAFLSGMGALVTGRPVGPQLLGRVGTLLGWLALAWRAAAAASRPATRLGVETELRQGALGWVAMGIAAFFSTPQLLGPILLGLGAFVAAGLDGLTLSQLHEFEHRYGASAERRGYRSTAASSLWIVIGGGTLAAWILVGGGGILPRVLGFLDEALVFLLTPVFIVVGYMAQLVAALFAWLLHGRKLKLPKVTAGGVPKNAYHPHVASTPPLWAVLAGRWLLVLAVVAVALLALALLRARRHDEVAAVGFVEEREDLPAAAGVPEGPSRRWRGAGSDVAIRRIFRRWLDLSADRGRGRASTETAREHFGRALAGSGELAARAAPLLDAYERGRYGQAGRPEDVAAAEAALDAIRRDWRT